MPKKTAPPALELWTCDFARVNRLTPDVAAVSIARWPPRTWGKHARCMALAPPADLLRAVKSGAINWAEYAAAYRAHLATLDPATVAASLPPRAALLCFCAPGEDCHRYLAAEWLSAHLGIQIGEWEMPDLEREAEEGAEAAEEPAEAEEQDYSARCDHCKKLNALPGKVSEWTCGKCGRSFAIEWD